MSGATHRDTPATSQPPSPDPQAANFQGINEIPENQTQAALPPSAAGRRRPPGEGRVPEPPAPCLPEPRPAPQPISGPREPRARPQSGPHQGLLAEGRQLMEVIFFGEGALVIPGLHQVGGAGREAELDTALSCL